MPVLSKLFEQWGLVRHRVFTLCKSMVATWTGSFTTPGGITIASPSTADVATTSVDDVKDTIETYIIFRLLQESTAISAAREAADTYSSVFEAA